MDKNIIINVTYVIKFIKWMTVEMEKRDKKEDR